MTHPTPTYKGTAIMEDEKRTDLIAQLKSATEGSRELDGLIHQAITGFECCKVMPDSIAAGEKLEWVYLNEDGYVVRRYTTSLDAALTLVPEEWQGVYLSSEWQGITRDPSLCKFGASLRRGLHSYVMTEAKAASLPLALCIATLKAKDSTDGR